jgi:predicted amidohydrolase
VTTFNVGVVQIDTQQDKQANLEKIRKFVEGAAAKGADLVALPEYVNYIGDEKGEFENAEAVPGPTSEFFCALAKELGIWLHCGSILEKVEGMEKLYNTTLFVNPGGEIVARYRKIHLFDIEVENGVSFFESGTKKPGEEIVTVETDLANFGLSICYDVRFPELYRIMTLKGAEVLMVPAEFALYTGRDHWESLLKARAIENTCYVVAPGQIGVKPAYQALGRSLVIDPWGTVNAVSSDKEGFFVTELDMGYLRRIRAQNPCLKNRRPKTYTWKEEDRA